MRPLASMLGILAATLAPIGCAMEGVPTDELGLDTLVGDVAGATASTTSTSDSASSSAVTPSPAAFASDAQSQSAATFRGEVYGSDDYRLYNLGAAYAGEQWTVKRTAWGDEDFTVVLFDQNYDMLYRSVLGSSGSLTHVLREGVDNLYVAFARSSSSAGGAFEFEANYLSGAAVPAPRTQVVYLNFEGTSNLTVNRRTGISFPPFDAAMLGDEYAGQTQEIKDIILAEMQRDYAAYDVQIISSDDGPPSGTYSIVHFGGDGAGLLGLADNVDKYNSNQTQNAAVFVNSYSLYWTMKLSTVEMGQMVSNTASHELGHLLGLYHTEDPEELMDTTGSAWDLVEDQQFKQAPLHDTVFPFGYENTPKLLLQTVGPRPGGALDVDKSEDVAKSISRAKIREFMKQELPSRCGNCLHLDD
ncbi:MAG: matrixin family metalloprotease [Phycisphaerae bacterium]|nr:matrixin family metalloprotease [Phycisphaerae bacterium]